MCMLRALPKSSVFILKQSPFNTHTHTARAHMNTNTNTNTHTHTTYSYLKKPVFSPQCLRILSHKAPVDPFPLVPLMCRTLRLFKSCSCQAYLLLNTLIERPLPEGQQAEWTVLTCWIVSSSHVHQILLSSLARHSVSAFDLTCTLHPVSITLIISLIRRD